MKVLLLGATGTVGRRVAAELVRVDAVESLLLAGRNQEQLDELARLLAGTTEVVARPFDIGDPDYLREAFKEADIVASCAGPGYQLEELSVRAALEAGTPYVSLNDDLEATIRVAELDEEARSAGLGILSGFGFAPGLTNLLADLAARELDEVIEIEIAVAASAQDGSGDATALHFAHMLHNSGDRGPRLVYFPEPVGWTEVFTCSHPETLSLAERFPKLTDCSFRLGLIERAIMDTARASRAVGLFGSETARRLWLRSARPWQSLLARIPPTGSPWTAARVDVHGLAEGRPETVTLGIVDHLITLAALPLVAAVLQLGRGKGPTGVLRPDEVMQPRALLDWLSVHGLRAARLEPERL